MKTLRYNPSGKAGYTLIELVVVAAVIMVAGIMLLRLSGSITGRGQFSTTDNRMAVIDAKIRQYYLAHEQLPVNIPPLVVSEIPVGIDALDLEQKYRLDGWGHYYEYNAGVVTDLQDVNGRAVSITSGGPDQNIGTDDDIIQYIDLSVEAGQIVQKKLKMLMEKVATYDALFAGIDNDGVYWDNPASPSSAPEIDEDPLATANSGNTGCPPVAGFQNDPATGLPTLDSIEMAMDGVGGNTYACNETDPAGNPVQLAYHLATYYHLRTGFPGGYDIDPWNNPFHWGYEGRILDNTSITDPMDFRHHKFFSSGPDGILGPDGTTGTDDDIIYTGR